MICPKCGAEYRPGFTRCADCEVDLVAGRAGGALAAFLSDGWGHGAGETGKPGDPNEDPFCSFWKGTDARIWKELCAVLDEAGIPHKTIHRQDHLFNLASQVPYEVGVPASRYEAAESAVKEAFGSDEETGLDAMGLLPPPKEDPRAGSLRKIAGGLVFTDSAEDDDDEPDDPEMAPKADDSGELANVSLVKDEDWYPEDATRMVWDGNPPDFREAIEMGIAENNIRMRWAIEGGSPRLFVLPEHEKPANKIVKEVLEGTPQE